MEMMHLKGESGRNIARRMAYQFVLTFVKAEMLG